MSARVAWPDGARLAMSFVVNVEEQSEYSVAEGDKRPEPVDELGVALKRPIRNYGNESNYLYGIKAGAPRVLALLREHAVAEPLVVRAGDDVSYATLVDALDVARAGGIRIVSVAGDGE